MDRIYMDYACTSFPKPDEVVRAVTDYMTRVGGNVSRGSYKNAYEAEEMVYETRSMLCDLFNGSDPKNVIFTKNITESLNFLIKGLLKKGDHVLVSAMEHNAVMRPLNQIAEEINAGDECLYIEHSLKSDGTVSDDNSQDTVCRKTTTAVKSSFTADEGKIFFSRIPCDSAGNPETDSIEDLIRPNTRAVIMLTASNVSGTLMPIEEVGRICRKRGLLLIVDSAQTAGTFPVDMKADCIDALAFTGHKGLLGPQGTGGFIVSDVLAAQMEPLITGGTGSFSHMEETPSILPDKFEAGTMNLPGIAGLGAALRFLKDRGTDSILSHERSMTRLFLTMIGPLENDGLLRIAGPRTADERAAVVSVVPTAMDPAQLAFLLEQEYGVMTRVGLHCAPSAHKCLGTFPGGTVRFSFGWATTEEEVEKAARALTEIVVV